MGALSKTIEVDCLFAVKKLVHKLLGEKLMTVTIGYCFALYKTIPFLTRVDGSDFYTKKSVAVSC